MIIRLLAPFLLGLLFDGITRAPVPPAPKPPVPEAEICAYIPEDVPQDAREASESVETSGQAEIPPEPVSLSCEDERAAEYIAKTLYGECRACSPTEKSAVVWCILNRVDSEERYFPDDIISVVTQPYQFLGYGAENPVTDELLAMATDVMLRWRAEKAGEKDVGRTLPREYCFFWGDMKHNHFTAEWKGTETWDWSLPSPYADEKEE